MQPPNDYLTIVQERCRRLASSTAIAAVLFAGTSTATTCVSAAQTSMGVEARAELPQPTAKVDRARLKRALAPLHEKYDRAERMLKDKFSSPGYHTTLKGGYVHSTRSSLSYAVALLDTGDDALVGRAEDILERVIRLQDQTPHSPTYGIWPWFLEEPLDKMSPPDWNWADFCGTALLQVAIEHRDRVSPWILQLVDEAIQHAARSIKKRNVGPGYTNIAIMGTYVTLLTGELYGIAEMTNYAAERWARFHAHTLHHGGFTEYNSPTYTIVALKELGRLLRHAKHPEVRKTASEIYEMAWEDIARHFHPGTRQWAGPHSRCYRTLLGNDVLALITRATQGRVNLGVDQPSIDEARLELDCPERLEHYFTQLSEPRDWRQTFVNSQKPVIGTTYMVPEFALGSVNRGDFWNQRRPVLAYAGTAEMPSYLRVRFLHDLYDFTAAQVYSAQEKGRVLAGIAFATDGGDTHPSLDKVKNGTITAEDIRLRFEFGGAAAMSGLIPPRKLDSPASAHFGDSKVQILVPYARWGSTQGKWESGKDSETAWLDVVLYKGKRKQFELNELKQAAIGFALEITVEGQTRVIDARATASEGKTLVLKWGDLALRVPSAPAPLSAMP